MTDMMTTVLEQRARKKPQLNAALFLQNGEQETAWLTYAELNAKAKQIAAWLLDKDLTGCRVLLLYPTGLEFLSGLIGCWYAGAIAVPISCPKADEFETHQALLNAIAVDADIAAVFTIEELQTAIQSHLTQQVPVLATDTLSTNTTSVLHPVPIQDDTIAYLQYTSGSTSAPKAAIISHGNLRHSLNETLKVWRYNKNSVTLTWAPHTHVYGLVCGLLMPLYHGTLTIILPAAAVIKNPLVWLSAISKYRVTHSGCPNFGYDLCVRHIDEASTAHLDLQHWIVAVNGGDMVQPETLTAFSKKFQPCGFKLKSFCSAYGMSELSGAIATTSVQNEPSFFTLPEDTRQRVSSGPLLPGLQAIAIDPETGRALVDGEVGEICLLGQSLVSGYWRRPEETAETFSVTIPNHPGAFFRTGDLGYIEKRHIHLTGRLKEVIVIYGKKYYPYDIERTVAQTLKTKGMVLPQIVFSTEVNGQEVVIVVQELTQLSDATLTDAIRHAITKEHGINIHQVVYVPAGSIPKTASGKLQRKKGQLLFQQQGLVTLSEDSPTPISTSTASIADSELFLSLVAKVLNIDKANIDMHAPLSRYAFDSIHIIQLTTLLNETYQLSISPAALYEYPTLSAFYHDWLAPVQPSVSAQHNTTTGTDHHHDIAIIGISGLFPKAEDLDMFWDNLAEGRDCISEVPPSRWDWREKTLQWGGFIDGLDHFDADFFNISPREAVLIDPQQRLFLQTVWKTIEDAGYTTATLAHLKTGLFVGVFNHDYAELLQKNDVMDAYLTTSTLHSMIANRISYILNFNGPSEAIDTACSSSLVAIHHAVQAMLQGDCDIAIAGGVNALITPTAFMSANQAGMLSSDGRCKTFDKDANGYVRSEGVGALLLKPLSKALADGDHIYGVIKGTAINHGGHAHSLTAPNPNAQADVIISACRRANVPIDTLQFIETHGTGTPLGDPIEMNGLKKAFQHLAIEQSISTLPTQYCGLTAVKTNIGHLESAAGIAGVLKLLLALQHETMPANIHLNQINPYIQLEESPFYIVNQTTPWPKNTSGIPRRAGVSSFGFGGANAHVVLEESPLGHPHHCHGTHPQHEHFIIPLSARTPLALQQRMADLLHWLQRQTTTPCLAALSYTLAVGRAHFSHRYALVARTIVDLEAQLSDVLTQRHEGQQVVSTHPLCEDYLLEKNIDWHEYYGNFQGKLSLPTYPFAKTSHWIKTQLPPLSALHALIDDNISTQNTLRFKKQFSGHEWYLEEHQIHGEPILPGVVAIEMARASMGLSSMPGPFATLENIVWHTPIKRTDLSTPLHITLSTQEESVAFQITNHTESTVFMTGHCRNDHVPILHDLSEESNHRPPVLDIQSIQSSLTHRQTPEDIYHSFRQAGIVYGPRFQVIEDLYYNDTQVLATLSLPTSLLAERTQYSVPPCLFDGILQSTQALLKQRDTLYLPLSIRHLQQHAAMPETCFVHAQAMLSEHRTGLVICNIQVYDEALQLVLTIDGFALRALTHGVRGVDATSSTQHTVPCYQPIWIKKACGSYSLNSECSILVMGNCETTLHDIGAQFPANRVTYQFIHAADETSYRVSSLADYIVIALPPTPNDALSNIEAALDSNYYLIYAIVRHIMSLKPQHRTHLILLSQTPSLFSRALVGLAKTLPLEQLNMVCRYIELTSIDRLPQELTQPDVDVRYDDQHQRYVPHYQALPHTPAHLRPISLKSAGVYLITGGLGGLGYLFAKHLATHYNAHLVLAGRSALSATHQETLQRLKQHAASVSYVQADVSVAGDVQALIHEIKTTIGTLNGIFHAAGVTQDGLLMHKTAAQMKTVADPKIYGTCHLHQATLNEPLDCFILFSSIAATFGNAGQSDYAYANCFLDEFAHMRTQQQLQGLCSGQTLSINWPLWQEGGLTIAPEYQQWLLKTMGIESLTTKQGLAAFTQLLANHVSNAVVLPGDQALLMKTLNHRLNISPMSSASQKIDHPTLHQQTTHFLKQLLANTTQRAAESIDEHVALEAYGIDSLMIIDLNQTLSKQFSGLPQTLFFEYQTLTALTDYFVEHQADALRQSGIVEAASSSAATLSQPDPRTETVTISDTQPSSEDIAIIGIDGCYPQSNNLNEFWNNLLSGQDCITEIPESRWHWPDHFDDNQDAYGKTYSKWGGFIQNPQQFDPLFFNISPREASLMDPQERLFLQTAWKTIENAGYPKEHLAGKKVGVYVGVMYSEYQLFAQDNHASSFIPTHAMLSSIANRVSYWFDFHGPSIALDTMCSSSLTAIHLACQSLREGECSLALAGGVNLSIHPQKYLLLSHGKFLSSDGHCRSFGEGGNGYVPGEGVGAVLLKRLSQAIQDGDYIHAVIKGSHINHGGKTNGYTVPNPNAQAQLIAETYQKANLSPSMVSYIEAHGTGTSLGDPIEMAGLNKVFKQEGQLHRCAIGSVKSNIGHCESAAGIAAVTKVVLQLQHRLLVPSLMSDTLNPNIDWESTPFTLQRTLSEWKVSEDENSIPSRVAGISSFGAGGANAHLIISEAPLREMMTHDHPSAYLLTLSAKTESALQQRIRDLLTWLRHNPCTNLQQVSYTLNCGRTHFEHRCAIVVNTIEEAIKALEQLELQPNVSPSAHNHRYASILHAYLAGQTVNWRAMFSDATPQKIPLPTYPFAEESYWYTDAHDVRDETTAPSVQQTTLQADVTSFLIQQVIHILNLAHHGVSAEKNLGEYGMDSIHFIELSKSIARHYNIELTPAIWNTYNDLSAISDYLIRQYPEQIARMHAATVTPVSRVLAAAIKPSAASSSPVHRFDVFPNETRNLLFTHGDPSSQAPLDDVCEGAHSKPTKGSHQHTSDSVQDIAIIGMHGLFPQAEDMTTFWDNLFNGKDGVTEIPSTRWDWRTYFGDSAQHNNQSNSKWGSFIENIDQFDAAFFNLSAREANLMDPQHRLFLEVVWKTIEDAGYNPFDLGTHNVGVFAGIEFNEYQSLIAKSQKEFHGFVASGNAHSMLANRISYFFNFQGPSEAIDTACSSSLVAIHRAVQALRHHECNVAIAGGVSLILNPDTYVITSQLGALSPDGHCKTFDQSANGYVKGEGIAALLLKPLHQAKLDGDAIYGVIKASAVNHGGKAQSLTAPNASAQGQLLINAYTQAGIDPTTVSLIETHGTGTMLGDPVEVEGLKIAFSKLLGASYPTSQIALSSVKTNIGHLEAASGIAGVIKVLLSMMHETIPAILHFQTLNPYIHLDDTPFYIANQTQAWQRLKTKEGQTVPLRAGVSSFGFGGTNAHVVLEEGRPHVSTVTPAAAKPYYLFTLSAKHAESLQQKIIDLQQWIANQTQPLSLPALSFTLNVGRAHFEYRCALVVQSIEELSNTLIMLTAQTIPEHCMMNQGQACHMQGPVFETVHQWALEGLQQSKNPEHYRQQLMLLADLYTKHYPIDWNTLFSGETIQRVRSLPVYPFNKQRYWFDVAFNAGTSSEVQSPVAKTNGDLNQRAVMSWLQMLFAEALHIKAADIQPNQTYEVYGVDSVMGLDITHRLAKIVNPIPKTILYEQRCLADLANYLIQHHAAAIHLHVDENRVRSAEVLQIEEPMTQPSPLINQPDPVHTIANDIAIIGLSGTFPMANTMDEFWGNLTAGRDCITEVPKDRWHYQDYPVDNGNEQQTFPYGGFIPDVDKFDPKFFNISGRDAALMDPQERLFMQSAWSALEDAGYNRDKLNHLVHHAVGVFVGASFNYYPLFIAEEWQKNNRIPLDIQSFSIANRLSYFLNLNGPSFVVDTACSSSLAAIHLACESIRQGECNMAIAGGVNLSLHPSKYHFLGSFGFMSSEGRCASFAEGGKGYVPAEGVGAVILKPLAKAIQDNDTIYGVIKGSSMNHGGKTSGYTVPNPTAQSAVISKALQQARIDPRTISYVEAHGTGTSLGDPIEIRGLQTAYETYTPDKQYCAIGSVKSNIGHLEAAAGISQIAKVLLQMRHQTLVPTLHTEQLNSLIDFDQSPFYVQRHVQEWTTTPNTPRRAAISSFGAGGTNVHMIIEEHISATPKAFTEDHVPFLWLISALDEERLADYIQIMTDFLQNNDDTTHPIWLRNAAYTLQTGREHMRARCAILASNKAELLAALSHYPKAITHQSFISHHAADTKDHSLDTRAYQRPIAYEAIAHHWIHGGLVNWDGLYPSDKPSIVSLPTYPFAKRRCWITTQTAEPSSAALTVKTAEDETTHSLCPVYKTHAPVNDWLYAMTWVPHPRSLTTATKPQHSTGQWLIISDLELGVVLQHQLGTEACIYCFTGESYSKHSDTVYYINPSQPADYAALFAAIHTSHRDELKGILYVCTPHPDDNVASDPSIHLFHCFKGLLNHIWPQTLTFCLVTQSAHRINAQDSIDIWQHPLWAMTRIFAAEQTNVQALLLDLDPHNGLHNNAETIVQELEHHHTAHNHVAYRKTERYTLRFVPEPHSQQHTPPWHAPNAVLITGGLGALGYEVARFVIEQGCRCVLLTGTTQLSSQTVEKNQWLQQLRATGAKVHYAAIDVTDAVSMQRLIQETETAWNQPIDGVFHLAGVTTENVPMATLDESLLRHVLDVKVKGAMVLHHLFESSHLSCFVLFSSIAAVPHFGIAGLSAYAAANAFLNGLASYRRSLEQPAISINWVAWSEKGMSHQHQHDAFLGAVGITSLKVQQGMAVLHEILQRNPTELTVCKINWDLFLSLNPSAKQHDFFTHFVAKNTLTPITTHKTKPNKEDIQRIVHTTFADVLAFHLNEIDAHTPFAHYGMDSVTGITFVAALNQHFPDRLSPMDLYRYPTLNQLVDYLLPPVDTPTVVTQTDNQDMSLDKLNRDELNALIEAELNELELIYD